MNRIFSWAKDKVGNVVTKLVQSGQEVVLNRIICGFLRGKVGPFLEKNLEIAQVKGNVVTGKYEVLGPLELKASAAEKLLQNTPFDFVEGSITNKISLDAHAMLLVRSDVNVKLEIDGVHMAIRYNPTKVMTTTPPTAATTAPSVPPQVPVTSASFTQELKDVVVDGESVGADLGDYVMTVCNRASALMKNLDIQIMFPAEDGTFVHVLHLMIPAITLVSNAEETSLNGDFTKEIQFPRILTQLYVLGGSDTPTTSSWNDMLYDRYLCCSVSPDSTPNSLSVTMSEAKGLMSLKVSLQAIHGIFTPDSLVQLSRISSLVASMPTNTKAFKEPPPPSPLFCGLIMQEFSMACTYDNDVACKQAVGLNWEGYLKAHTLSPCNDLLTSHVLCVVQNVELSNHPVLMPLESESRTSTICKIHGGTQLDVRLKSIALLDVFEGNRQSLVTMESEVAPACNAMLRSSAVVRRDVIIQGRSEYYAARESEITLSPIKIGFLMNAQNNALDRIIALKDNLRVVQATTGSAHVTPLPVDEFQDALSDLDFEDAQRREDVDLETVLNLRLPCVVVSLSIPCLNPSLAPTDVCNQVLQSIYSKGAADVFPYSLKVELNGMLFQSKFDTYLVCPDNVLVDNVSGYFLDTRNGQRHIFATITRPQVVRTPRRFASVSGSPLRGEVFDNFIQDAETQSRLIQNSTEEIGFVIHSIVVNMMQDDVVLLQLFAQYATEQAQSTTQKLASRSRDNHQAVHSPTPYLIVMEVQCEDIVFELCPPRLDAKRRPLSNAYWRSTLVDHPTESENVLHKYTCKISRPRLFAATTTPSFTVAVVTVQDVTLDDTSASKLHFLSVMKPTTTPSEVAISNRFPGVLRCVYRSQGKDPSLTVHVHDLVLSIPETYPGDDLASGMAFMFRAEQRITLPPPPPPSVLQMSIVIESTFIEIQSEAKVVIYNNSVKFDVDNRSFPQRYVSIECLDTSLYMNPLFIGDFKECYTALGTSKDTRRLLPALGFIEIVQLNHKVVTPADHTVNNPVVHLELTPASSTVTLSSWSCNVECAPNTLCYLRQFLQTWGNADDLSSRMVASPSSLFHDPRLVAIYPDVVPVLPSRTVVTQAPPSIIQKALQTQLTVDSFVKPKNRLFQEIPEDIRWVVNYVPKDRKVDLVVNEDGVMTLKSEEDESDVAMTEDHEGVEATTVGTTPPPEEQQADVTDSGFFNGESVSPIDNSPRTDFPFEYKTFPNPQMVIDVKNCSVSCNVLATNQQFGGGVREDVPDWVVVTHVAGVDFSISGIWAHVCVLASLPSIAPTEPSLSRHVCLSFDKVSVKHLLTDSKQLVILQSQGRRNRDSDETAVQATWDTYSLGRNIDQHLRLVLLPEIRLVIDEETLDFAETFQKKIAFTVKTLRPPSEPITGAMTSPPPPPLYFQHFEVSEVKLLVDYRGSFGKSIEKLKLRFRPVQLRSGATIGSIMKHTITKYRESLMKMSFVLRVVSTAGPVRSVQNVGTSLRDAVLMPYEYYVQNKPVYKGVICGVRTLSATVVGELCSLGATLTNVASRGTDAIARVLGYDGMITPAARDEPNNLREGLMGAGAEVAEGLTGTTQIIREVVCGRRITAAPMVLILPVRGLLGSIELSFVGMRNAMQPQLKKEKDALFTK